MLLIPSPEGHLEAIFDGVAEARRVMVLCHPHPQYGGSMHDAVVDSVASVAHRHGFATLKFNFRGVGESSGRFDNGVGEVDDLLAALQWMRERIGPLPIWLAGYSFGSNVVWRAIESAGALAGVILVAPPIARMDFGKVGPSAIYVIAGDDDDFVDTADLVRWTTDTVPTANVQIVAGADHFFSGTHADLARAVDGVLASVASRNR